MYTNTYSPPFFQPDILHPTSIVNNLDMRPELLHLRSGAGVLEIGPGRKYDHLLELLRYAEDQHINDLHLAVVATLISTDGTAYGKLADQGVVFRQMFVQELQPDDIGFEVDLAYAAGINFQYYSRTPQEVLAGIRGINRVLSEKGKMVFSIDRYRNSLNPDEFLYTLIINAYGPAATFQSFDILRLLRDLGIDYELVPLAEKPLRTQEWQRAQGQSTLKIPRFEDIVDMQAIDWPSYLMSHEELKALFTMDDDHILSQLVAFRDRLPRVTHVG